MTMSSRQMVSPNVFPRTIRSLYFPSLERCNPTLDSMQSVVNHNSYSKGGLNFAHLTRQIILHQECPAQEMEITKNKDPSARLKIFHRFLNPNPRIWFFLLEITNIWQKSRDFWFADFFLEIFKIYRLVWIFLWIFACFESVSSMFHFDLYKYSLY